MLEISFELVPVTHIIFMTICWTSFFIYIRILYIVNTRRHKEFKSSFFLLIKLHAITDITMFLFVEFVARPRKYRIHNLLYPATDFWLPQVIYFSQTTIKNTMFLGYLVVAVNRFTVMFNSKYHCQIWTPMIISLVYATEWLVPSTVLLELFFFTGNHNFSFLAASNGGLSMRANADFMKLDALQDFIISTSCFVISSLLYLGTFVILWKKVRIVGPIRTFLSSAAENQQKVTSTEIIIFKCAFFSFLFFIPNFIKTTVLYFATDTNIINLATDLWYFTTELMSISSCWSLLMSSRRIREEFLPHWRNPFSTSMIVSTVSNTRN